MHVSSWDPHLYEIELMKYEIRYSSTNSHAKTRSNGMIVFLLLLHPWHIWIYLVCASCLVYTETAF